MELFNQEIKNIKIKKLGNYENPFAFLLFWPITQKRIYQEKVFIPKLEKLFLYPINQIPLYLILDKKTKETPQELEKITNRYTRFVYSKKLNAFHETNLSEYLTQQKAETLILLGRGMPWIFENAKIAVEEKKYQIRIVKEGFIGSPKEMAFLDMKWYTHNAKKVHEDFYWLRESLINSLKKLPELS